MATIALLVCLSASPDRCRTVEIYVEACTALGIAVLAQWAAANPEYFVKAWSSCQTGQPT